MVLKKGGINTLLPFFIIGDKIMTRQIIISNYKYEETSAFLFFGCSILILRDQACFWWLNWQSLGKEVLNRFSLRFIRWSWLMYADKFCILIVCDTITKNIVDNLTFSYTCINRFCFIYKLACPALRLRIYQLSG